MRRGQWVAVAVAVFINALDGYDAASISFAAPGIAEAWGLAPDTLGWVLSMELIGMAVGSVLFGGVADRFGRRPAILLCLVVMAAGMFGAAAANGVAILSLLRIGTGLGIGGMLAALTALISEYSNERRRALVVATMVVGYPLGTVLGGIVARNLLVAADWRAVFLFGGVSTLVALPLAFFLLPESVAWLERRQPRNALQRLNATLARFGHTLADRLPDRPAEKARAAVVEIFRGGLARTTVLLTLAYFAHISCYYFIFKWMPKLVVDFGYEPANGADVLVTSMLGAAIGGPLFGLIAGRFTLRRATIGALLGSALAVNLFANITPDLALLAAAGFAVGLFANSAGVGFYALLAAAYPANVRATGTGFGIGVGRAGAALGPAIGGELFADGWGLAAVALAMSAGSLLAILFILGLKLKAKEPATA